MVTIGIGERTFEVQNCRIRQQLTLAPLADGSSPASVRAQDCPGYEMNEKVSDGLHAHQTIELENPYAEDGLVCRVPGCIHYINMMARIEGE